MSSSSVIVDLGLNCPKGGDFYICNGAKTEFFGCCASNPCSDGIGKCPTKDRRISAFNPDKYANIPAQSCDDARPANETFYTCTRDISFIGCCASNPCKEPDGLCPITNLLPATLSPDKSSRAVLVPKESASSSASGGDSSGGGGGLSTGAIVGIAIGAAVAVGIVIALIWRCGWHARKRNERREPTWDPAPQGNHPEMGYVAPAHSPSPFDPSRSPGPYDPAHSPAPYDPRASYAGSTAVPGYAASSSPNSAYYHMKHPGSPSIDERRISSYTDSNVSSVSGFHSRQMSQYSGMGNGMGNNNNNNGLATDLHPVSELDGIEHQPQHNPQQTPSAPVAELGDGTPSQKQ